MYVCKCTYDHYNKLTNLTVLWLVALVSMQLDTLQRGIFSSIYCRLTGKLADLYFTTRGEETMTENEFKFSITHEFPIVYDIYQSITNVHSRIYLAEF